MVPYFVTGVMSLVTGFAVCKLNLAMFLNWVGEYPEDLLCTYQNFLHGTAMLPQLVVFRQRGFVAPAAARFLVLTGIKHIMEFASDLAVTFFLWSNGKLKFYEVSYIFADVFAALMLLDFLYLVLASSNCYYMIGCCRR